MLTFYKGQSQALRAPYTVNHNSLHGLPCLSVCLRSSVNTQFRGQLFFKFNVTVLQKKVDRFYRFSTTLTHFI